MRITLDESSCHPYLSDILSPLLDAIEVAALYLYLAVASA